ncbi:unnamed protein product [Medioppia subpectinata]|uniref:Bladder cancer-associated protein n=1 Tax=Medioppia subpectinata TaxID=1979941 RepID=A0A7R9Q2K1_9ACAR|nr:unnamed protein product [Medioppia subpectinata]CAG2109527.1 unnamed protein product [Medioppia subpectinata]
MITDPKTETDSLCVFWCFSVRKKAKMYCLQWLIPVLLIPKPMNATLVQNHVMLVVLYLIGYVLERKPCTICSLVFAVAVFLLCFSGLGNCIFSLFVSNCEHNYSSDTQCNANTNHHYL